MSTCGDADSLLVLSRYGNTIKRLKGSDCKRKAKRLKKEKKVTWETNRGQGNKELWQQDVKEKNSHQPQAEEEEERG